MDYGAASCGGAGLLVIATTSTGCLLAASHVLDRGQEAGGVGEAVAGELLGTLDHGGCVDEYLQDQLVIFMALAAGAAVYVHTHECAWVARGVFRVYAQLALRTFLSDARTRFRDMRFQLRASISNCTPQLTALHSLFRGSSTPLVLGM